jgi:DNA invertase Pin-like site-specific DNA recombinase
LAEFERSIIRERTKAGLAAAKLRGKVGGRPPAMNAEDIEVAKALLADPSITSKKVAERLGISVSTLYKHIPAARAVITRGEPAE